MKLDIRTPVACVATVPAIAHLRAEDQTGSFGLWPRHADFLTVLVPGVVQWRTENGTEGFAAVDGGLLHVCGGDVMILAPRAAVGADLESLGDVLHQSDSSREAAERVAQSVQRRLGTATLQRMLRVGRHEPASASVGEFR